MTFRPPASRDEAYFAALYAADPDPWNFTESAYEHRKYQATIAALEGRRFERGFEIGCSIGVLTRILAPLCASLFAVDIADAALAAARTRCGHLPHVTFAKLRVPDRLPEDTCFDLILISEVLYFLTPVDIAQIARHVTASVSAGGTVLLVNYTEPIDEPSSGDAAAEIFIAATKSSLCVTFHERHDRFRIDRLNRIPQKKLKVSENNT